jgi:hypothetical protein
MVLGNTEQMVNAIIKEVTEEKLLRVRETPNCPCAHLQNF